ncbi:MAG: hypothetical protein GC134_00635 [Proteobacteria bacterium]|nr:hypothetical protein [Pseudomonadota bacterium]
MLDTIKNLPNKTKLIIGGAIAAVLLVAVFAFSGGKSYEGTPCAGLEQTVCQQVDSIKFKSEEGWLKWTVKWDNGEVFTISSRNTEAGQRFKASMDTYVATIKSGGKVYYRIAPKKLFGGNLTELNFQFAPAYSAKADKHVEGFLLR